MNKTDMEHLWEKSGVLNSLKINKFTKDKTNLYKCTMTVLEEKTLDTITKTGYYKSASEAKYALENKLRAIKDERFPWKDYPGIKWKFSFQG